MPTERLVLRGTELRYVLTVYLLQRGPMTVAELVEALDAHSFALKGRPSKAVSDALRWERRRGRVRKHGRARYGPGGMPRSTEYRILRRVLALRDEAARRTAADEEAYWNAVLGPR